MGLQICGPLAIIEILLNLVFWGFESWRCIWLDCRCDTTRHLEVGDGGEERFEEAGLVG